MHSFDGVSSICWAHFVFLANFTTTLPTCCLPLQGSLEAVRDAVLALSGPHAAVKVVYGGVGPVTASDVNLALTTGAKLVAFNLSAPAPEVDGQLKLHRLQVPACHQAVCQHCPGVHGPFVRSMFWLLHPYPCC